MLGQCLGEILAQCEAFSFGRLGDCIAYFLFYSVSSISWFSSLSHVYIRYNNNILEV